TPCVDRLSGKYRRLTFHILAGDTTRLYRELLERNVGLVVSRMIGTLPDELAAEVLFYDSFAVLASAANPLTRRRKLTLADLMEEPWALLPSDRYLRGLGACAFRSNGHEPPRATVETLSEYMKNDLLATGRFLTVLPSFMLKVPGRHPRLKALPVALTNTRAPIELSTLKGRMLTPLAQLFIDNIRAIAKPMAQGA